MPARIIKNHLGAVAFALLVVAPLTWITLDRTPPFELISGITVPKEIKRGGTYRVQWKMHNVPNKQCPGVIYRYLHDSSGTLWSLPPSDASFGLIEDEPFTDMIEISGYPRKMPQDVALGKADIHFNVRFICNFTQYFWPLIVNFPPVDTTIIE